MQEKKSIKFRMTKEQWDFVRTEARKLGVTHDAVMKWRQRHVPWKWRMKLLEIADQEGFEIWPDDFEAPMR